MIDDENPFSLSSVYWPYKVWQRQEKDRQQQQVQNFLKQARISSCSSLSNVNNENGETCERATSPLRILTPAKRPSSTTTPNTHPIPIETTIIERPPTRNSSDRMIPTPAFRPSQSQRTGLIRKYSSPVIHFRFFLSFIQIDLVQQRNAQRPKWSHPSL